MTTIIPAEHLFRMARDQWAQAAVTMDDLADAEKLQIYFGTQVPEAVVKLWSPNFWGINDYTTSESFNHGVDNYCRPAGSLQAECRAFAGVIQDSCDDYVRTERINTELASGVHA